MGRLASAPHSFRAAWRAGSENQTKGCCGKPGLRGLRSWAGMTQGVAGLSPVGPKATSLGDPVPTPGPRASAPCAPATPDATPGQVRSSSPNHSALQHHLATFPLRTGSSTGKQQRLRLAWRSSPITKLDLLAAPPPRLRAPRCVLGLVGPADAEGPVIW